MNAGAHAPAFYWASVLFRLVAFGRWGAADPFFMLVR